jgi:uncharacterized protein (TIGR02001 family)
MKQSFIFLAATLAFFSFYTPVHAQSDSSSSGFNIGADFYSNYVWRGSKYGQGPAFQPTVEYSKGGFAIGVWGSFDASGYMEADPYISYTLPFGLSVGFFDYYYPGEGVSFFSDTCNAYEANLGYTVGGLSLSANYIFNEAAAAGSAGKDLYFEAGYSFKYFNVALGAGNGWHTSDGEFNVCNILFGATKTIDITEKFSVPVTGQIILNPDKKQLYVVIGFTL